MTSKLVKISEKTSNTKCSSCDCSAFEFVVKAMFLRLHTGAIGTNASVRQLEKECIPRLLSIFKTSHALGHSLQSEFQSGSVDFELLLPMANPLEHDALLTKEVLEAKKEKLVGAKESTHNFVRWQSQLLQGDFDNILQEMEETNGSVVITGLEVKAFTRLTVENDVFEKRRLEKQQEENAKHLANIATQPPQEPEENILETQSSFTLPLHEEQTSLPEGPTKEEIIEADRREHCVHYLASRLTFQEMKPTKSGFRDVFKASALIRQRDTFVLPARHIPRHALVYDPASDQLPPTFECDGERETSRNRPVGPDLQLLKIATEAFREICVGDTDAILVPSAQAKGTAEVKKSLSQKFRSDHDLNLIYKQHRRYHLLEPVCLYTDQFATSNLARLHFQLTTTAADAILLVDPPENDKPELQITVGEKEVLCGADKLTVAERSLPKDSKVTLFKQEKTWRVCQEILYHFGVTSMTLLSAGNGNWLRAGIAMDMRMLVFVRADSRQKQLEKYLLEWMMEESKNPSCAYFISRAQIIDNRGLENDEVTVPTGDQTASSQTKKGGEEQEEEEEDEEGQEEEEEEEEEEDEGEEGEPPKKGRGKNLLPRRRSQRVNSPPSQ